jgi:hypothetical protein
VADDDSVHLVAYRAGSAAWGELGCADGQDAAGLWTDPHAPLRARMLIALQYDRRPTDRALVVYLFEQEVERHVREPFAGLHEALERASFLLASYHDPADTVRFWRAKLANFDVYCGLDVRYLVAAGLEPTLALLRGSEDAEHAAILSYLEQYDAARFAPDALGAWWGEQEQRFPSRLEDEAAQVRLQRALDAGDREEARRWLETWEAREPPTHALLAELAAYWEELGDLGRACALQRRVIASVPEGDFAALTRFVATCKLAELLRRHGELAAVWQTLLQAEQVHGAEPEWMAETARRDLAWQAIRLAATAPPGDALGPRALAWARELLARGCPLSVALLEEGCAAAARLGDVRAGTWLEGLLARERAGVVVDGTNGE